MRTDHFGADAAGPADEGLAPRELWASLFGPVTPDLFFREWFEQRPLHVRSGPVNRHARWLTRAELEAVIAHRPLGKKDVDLVSRAREISKHLYTTEDDRIDPAGVFDQFARGATIVSTYLHEHVPALAGLCAELAQVFSARVQTNVYFTPPNAQGFDVHFDTHDVLVLQIEGVKRWRLWGFGERAPLKGQHHDAYPKPEGPPEVELELGPGDTLYVPRGLWHAAASTDTASLHVTTGLMTTSWMELLLEAVAGRALETHELRRSLPPTFARADFDEAAALETFRGLLDSLATQDSLRRATDRLRSDLVARVRPPLTGQLEQALEADALVDVDVLEARPGVALHRLVDEGERVALECAGRRLTFPAAARPALEYVTRRRRFRVGEVPGLDAEGRRVLGARLVREGLFARAADRKEPAES